MNDNTETDMQPNSVQPGDADESDRPTEGPPSEAAEGADVCSTPAEQEEPPSPEEQIAELEDRYRRALAETHNVRRRAEEERRNAMRYGISAFARDMLSVSDNLGRALEAAGRENSDKEDKPGAFSDLIEGIQVIQRELLEIMGRHGIRQMDPLGERFDPNYHEAVFESDKQSGHDFDVVVEVAQSGYMVGERLLRPARVGISRAKSKDAPAALETEAPRTEDSPPKPESRQDEEESANAVP